MSKFLVKRKHTDNHPAVYRTSNGKIRNTILPKISASENGRMLEEDYHACCDSVQEELGLSYSPKNWHKRMGKYVKTIKKGEDTYYTLTRVGRNLVKIVIDNE